MSQDFETYAAWGVAHNVTRPTFSFYVARAVLINGKSVRMQFLTSTKGRVRVFKSREKAQAEADSANGKTS